MKPEALLEKTPPDVVRETALAALRALHVLSLMDDEMKDEATEHVQGLIAALKSKVPPSSTES